MESAIKKESNAIVSHIMSGDAKGLDEVLGGAVKDIRTDIREETGKLRQTAEELAQKNEIEIHQLAKVIVSKRLEEMMDAEIARLGKIGEMTESQQEQIRAIIRGYRYTEMTESPILLNAIGETEKILSNFCRQEKAAVLKADHLGDKIHALGERVDSYARRLEAFSNVTAEEHAQKILRGLSDGLQHNKGLTDLCRRIDNLINKDGGYRSATGKDFRTMDLIVPMLGKIEKRVGRNLEAKLKPFVAKHIETVKKITETVKSVKEQIRIAEEKFRSAVKSYETMARSYAENFTKKIAAEISSKINISLGGGLKI